MSDQAVGILVLIIFVFSVCVVIFWAWGVAVSRKVRRDAMRRECSETYGRARNELCDQVESHRAIVAYVDAAIERKLSK